MIELRTISRAILTVLLAAAFLAMSIASGLHELTHLARHAHAVQTARGSSAIAGRELAHIDDTAPAQNSSTSSDFCFFCTFGSSTTFSFATIDLAPRIVALPGYTVQPAPDLASLSPCLPSLRAPPSVA
jgi:hypothetical protein